MADNVRVALILGDGFEDSEFRVPYDRLKAEGYDITIIGKKAKAKLEGKRGKEKVKSDVSIDDVDPIDFDMLLIPGGYSPDHLRADERFVKFVKDFNQSGKWIAAVCHGPQLFISAGLVKGRTLTAWPTVQADLEAAGAHVEDDEVVIDRNWITSRKPDDLEAFSDAILEHVLPHGEGVHPAAAGDEASLPS